MFIHWRLSYGAQWRAAKMVKRKISSVKANGASAALGLSAPIGGAVALLSMLVLR
jgi:hypothetical protein